MELGKTKMDGEEKKLLKCAQYYVKIDIQCLINIFCANINECTIICKQFTSHIASPGCFQLVIGLSCSSVYNYF